jgi:hypothetical protein
MKPSETCHTCTAPLALGQVRVDMGSNPNVKRQLQVPDPKTQGKDASSRVFLFVLIDIDETKLHRALSDLFPALIMGSDYSIGVGSWESGPHRVTTE